jgi:hypothetical protein
MNRRQFLTNSIMLAAGVKLFAGQKTDNLNSTFSIEVVSKEPELVYSEINSLIRNTYKGMINVSESIMSGNYISDIVYIHSGNLINFYEDNADFSNRLRKIAKSITTKQALINPTLITFSSNNNSNAKYFDIFIDNALFERIPVNENHKELKFNTKKGELYISTEKGIASVSESSCKHKTCVEHKSISKPGTSIVCIPNKFRLAVSGSSNSIIDTLTF